VLVHCRESIRPHPRQDRLRQDRYHILGYALPAKTSQHKIINPYPYPYTYNYARLKLRPYNCEIVTHNIISDWVLVHCRYRESISPRPSRHQSSAKIAFKIDITHHTLVDYLQQCSAFLRTCCTIEIKNQQDPQFGQFDNTISSGIDLTSAQSQDKTQNSEERDMEMVNWVWFTTVLFDVEIHLRAFEVIR
jgi:hypothetical protein